MWWPPRNLAVARVVEGTTTPHPETWFKWRRHAFLTVDVMAGKLRRWRRHQHTTDLKPRYWNCKSATKNQDADYWSETKKLKLQSNTKMQTSYVRDRPRKVGNPAPPPDAHQEQGTAEQRQQVSVQVVKARWNSRCRGDWGVSRYYGLLMRN